MAVTPSATRGCHFSPPKVLFRTMRKRLMDMEQLRRDSHNRPEWEFCHKRPGYCSLCQEQVATTLDRHMMNVHLELGQLWRCPVEWCTVWKGSVSDCLSHLHEKHGGSQYAAMNNLESSPSVDCAPGLLAEGSSSGCVRHGGGRPPVS